MAKTQLERTGGATGGRILVFGKFPHFLKSNFKNFFPVLVP
jgi:hypothetical protein